MKKTEDLMVLSGDVFQNRVTPAGNGRYHMYVIDIFRHVCSIYAAYTWQTQRVLFIHLWSLLVAQEIHYTRRS